MGNGDRIKNHYEIREQISELEAENQLRKSLIIFGIHRVVVLNQIPKKAGKETNETARLKTQVNDYELYTNKLKQEHSTKLKLQDARLDSLKEENTKLKAQLRSLQQTASLGQRSLASGAERLSPFALAKFSMKSELPNISKRDNILSPIAPKRTYITSKNINKFTMLMNPGIRNQKHDILKKSDSQNTQTLNTTKDKAPRSPKDGTPNISKDSSFKEIPADLSTSSAIADKEKEGEVLEFKKPTPAKTPSKQLRGFDKSSSESNPDSPDFTPSKASSHTNLLPFKKMEKKSDFDTKLASLSHTDDETFASANSTMNGIKSDDETKSKSKKKKLQLRKSTTSKILALPEKNSKSFGLEDENLNSLNYYQDENFAAGDGDSPPKPSKKRKLDEDTPPPEYSRKKRKNIFKID